MKHVSGALLAVTALACAASAGAETLPGSEWSPVWLNGEPFAPITDPFLQFQQDGRYFGNGGCNTFRGGFVTNDGAILFGPSAMTMMACPEDVSQQEFEFVRALMSVRGFSRDGVDLTLTDADGMTVIKLKQRDAD